MRVAVTGGAGFIGSNLVQRLSETGHEVTVIDDFSTGLLSNLHGSKCDIKKVSILDRIALEDALSDANYIFHLAAVGSVPRSIIHPDRAFNINTVGTFNVLECARKSGASILFSSSSSVYGLNQDLPKNEKMWTQPISPYAASKLAAEALVTSYIFSYSMNNLVLRFFNVFGPKQRSDQDYAAVIPKWIRKGLDGTPVEVFGDGTATRDFTYVDFVVDIMLDAMKNKISHEIPINVATGNPVTLNELVETLREIIGDFSVKYSSERHGDVKHSQNNPILLRSIFPNLREVSLKEGLLRTIDWTRENAFN